MKEPSMSEPQRHYISRMIVRDVEQHLELSVEKPYSIAEVLELLNSDTAIKRGRHVVLAEDDRAIVAYIYNEEEDWIDLDDEPCHWEYHAEASE